MRLSISCQRSNEGLLSPSQPRGLVKRKSRVPHLGPVRRGTLQMWRPVRRSGSHVLCGTAPLFRQLPWLDISSILLSPNRTQPRYRAGWATEVSKSLNGYAECLTKNDLRTNYPQHSIWLGAVDQLQLDVSEHDNEDFPEFIPTSRPSCRGDCVSR